MNLILTKEKVFQNCEGIAIVANSQNIDALRKAYPVLDNYLNAKYIKMDGSDIFTLPATQGDKQLTLYVLVLPENFSNEEIFQKLGVLAKTYSGDKIARVMLDLSLAPKLLTKETLLAALKGIYAGGYALSQYKAKPKAKEPEDLYVYLNIEVPYWEELVNLLSAIRYARDLVDLPANYLKPAELAASVVANFRNTAVEVSVLEEQQAQVLGMNLYLSVAKGSTAAPKLIVMRYNGNPNSTERIGLIGKGITYDSGGYSIKPTSSMLTMKSDMGGAAAVIGAMKVLAFQRPNINVVGVVAACENMISGKAYLPGDIITSMNGKTVEIANTDAEGRLTLADAMTYAIRQEGATKVIDICTLTGACLVALAEEYAGVITKEDALWKVVEKVSEETIEPCWRLPLNKALAAKNKGKIADLTNSAGRWGGTITAGSFVGEFSEDLPWIHFDVAGTAFIEEDKSYMRQGATGFGVHLLTEIAKELSK